MMISSKYLNFALQYKSVALPTIFKRNFDIAMSNFQKIQTQLKAIAEIALSSSLSIKK